MIIKQVIFVYQNEVCIAGIPLSKTYVKREEVLDFCRYMEYDEVFVVYTDQLYSDPWQVYP